MKIFILLWFSWLLIYQTCAQSITSKLILTDSGDSSLLKADKEFDRDGHYCFTVRKSGKEYWYTDRDTLGPYGFIGSTFGNGGGVSYTNYYKDDKDKPYQYQNAKSAFVYRNVVGEIVRFMSSDTKDHMAITTVFGDSVFYYLDGEGVSASTKAKSEGFDFDEWCSFSENGHCIYWLKKDSLYSLYVDRKLVMTSESWFAGYHINNDGKYVFADGKKAKVPAGGREYVFFVHSRDTAIGPVANVAKQGIDDNGGYYFTGDDSVGEYMIVNNCLKRGIEDVGNIIIKDSVHFLYSFIESGKKMVSINGKSYEHRFQSIFCPTVDTNGNFAFLGLKDYYLYKYVNGKQLPAPVTRFDVRPIPLYISATGVALSYFKTDDSIYLYRDDELIGKTKNSAANFSALPYTEFFNRYDQNKFGTGNSLLYLEIDHVGYWVYNGNLSKPTVPALSNSMGGVPEVGAIVAGDFNEQGFYTVQYLSPGKFLININNSVYKTVEGIDQFIKDNTFYDGRTFVFYGMKDLSINQYTLKL